jgi:hypothetical protein
MKRNALRALCAVILPLLLSASCIESGPAGPMATLVPADAIAAAIVESPYKLYAEAAKFWKAASLDEVAGGDIESGLLKAEPKLAKLAGLLDFARPWAIAVLPLSASEGGGDKKVRELIYIPYRDEKAQDSEELTGSSDLHLVAKASCYLVYSDIEGEIAFPPAKGADLSRLSRYPASSVKLWGDPMAIRRATADSYKPIHEALRSFVTDPAQAASGKASTKALEELLLAFLAQLDLADASVELGSSGMTLRLGASVTRGSDLQKALLVGALAPAALPGAALISSGSMYGFAWSMDPALAVGLSERMYGSLFSSLGLSSEAEAEATASAKAIYAKWAKASGPSGAMSFDMDVDAAALASMGDLGADDAQAAALLLKKALRLRFDLFQDVKDEAAYRALLKGLATDPDYQALSKVYAEAFGLSFSMKSQDKKEGSFAYGELATDFEVVDSGKWDEQSEGQGAQASSSSKEGSEAFLAALESLAGARWAISGGKFIATSGDVAALKALAARKAAPDARSPSSLADDPAFAAFAKTMPPKQLFVGSFSMKRVMSLVESLSKASGDKDASLAGLPDSGLFGSWYSYLAIDSRGVSQARAPGLEMGLLVPAADIGALARSMDALSKLASPQKEGI